MYRSTLSLLVALSLLSCDAGRNQPVEGGVRSHSTAASPEMSNASASAVNEATCFLTRMTEENGQFFLYANYVQALPGNLAIEEA